jgi:hypothetical protein
VGWLFLWLGVLAVQLFYFFMRWLLCFSKKINVLHWSVSKRQKKCRAGGNNAEGFCVLASVCEQKPKPCLWVSLVQLCIVDDVLFCRWALFLADGMILCDFFLQVVKVVD